MAYIVHICSPAAWKAARDTGEYQADSLATEGFIHFSRPDQAVDTANRYYAGLQDLLLLWVDPQQLAAELHWEPSHGDLYPHLYGPLNLAAIAGVTDFSPDDEGVFRDLPVFP